MLHNLVFRFPFSIAWLNQRKKNAAQKKSGAENQACKDSFVFTSKFDSILKFQIFKAEKERNKKYLNDMKKPFGVTSFDTFGIFCLNKTREKTFELNKINK